MYINIYKEKEPQIDSKDQKKKGKNAIINLPPPKEKA